MSRARNTHWPRLSARHPLLVLCATAGFALIAFFGCSTVMGISQDHVYAPTFNYIDDDRLQSSMWQLAAGVEDLERLFATDAGPSQTQRADVVRILQQMDRAAAALGPSGWPSNHPRITQRLGWFRDRIASAKRAVESEPPRYYLAGSLSGACYACHGSESATD